MAVTRGRVCLAYALITEAELNFGAIFKSSMRKTRVHHGRRYTFEGLITKLCHHTGVLTDDLDYCLCIEAPPYNVANI